MHGHQATNTLFKGLAHVSVFLGDLKWGIREVVVANSEQLPHLHVCACQGSLDPLLQQRQAKDVADSCRWGFNEQCDLALARDL